MCLGAVGGGSMNEEPMCLGPPSDCRPQLGAVRVGIKGSVYIERSRGRKARKVRRGEDRDRGRGSEDRKRPEAEGRKRDWGILGLEGRRTVRARRESAGGRKAVREAGASRGWKEGGEGRGTEAQARSRLQLLTFSATLGKFPVRYADWDFFIYS